MSSLLEIEEAIERLPEEEVTALREWLAGRSATPKLTKWHGRGAGLVAEMGGVDAYIDRIRGRDDDCC